MSVIPSSHLVGIFTDRSAAEQAVEALYNAGFGREQVHYSAPGGFFDGLKSVFTGTNANSNILASNLDTMGLSEEEVQYYTEAYNNGNAIVAVHAAGREQEISNILDQYGAYGTAVKPHYYQGVTNPLEQPATDTPSDVYASSEQSIPDQQPVYVAPEIDAADPAAPAQSEQEATYEAAHAPQDSIETGNHDMTNTSESYDTAHEPQDSVTTSDYDTADQTTQPAQDVADTSATEVEQPVTRTDVTEIDEHVAVDQPEQQASVETPPEALSAPSQVEEQAMPSSVAPVDTVTEQHPTQVEEDVPAQEAEAPVSPSNAVNAASTNKLEVLLQQVQAMRQQLEETKTRLQAAKEHEAQLQTVRQQMQELQKELESAQAELLDTESRIQQY